MASLKYRGLDLMRHEKLTSSICLTDRFTEWESKNFRADVRSSRYGETNGSESFEPIDRSRALEKQWIVGHRARPSNEAR